MRNCGHAFLIAMIFCLSIGCAVGVPEVSSLGSFSAFASKSANPFGQESLGGALFFSGECLPGITGFEYRMNNHINWSPVPASAPVPNPVNYEYLVGTPEYDVDCSDGDFNFYVFKETAVGNFALNSATELPGDPTSIEIRGIGIEGLPTIVYNRIPPYTFEIWRDYYNSSHAALENSRAYPFRLKLKDMYGGHADIGPGDSKLVTVTLTDLDAIALPAGTIYDATCTNPATVANLTFNPGQDEISICFVADTTTDNHTIRLQVSSVGMLSNFVDLPIKPIHSAIPNLSSLGGGNLPPTLLKGVDYKFNLNLGPLYWGSSRFVNSYRGSFTMSSDSTVVFTRMMSDPDCPSGDQFGSMTCNVLTASKQFNMKIDATHLASNMVLSLSATPEVACSVNCTIFESTNFMIGGYVPQNFYFNVSSGSAVYNRPYFKLRDDNTMKLNQCSSLEIGEANVDGTIIPATGQTLTLSTVGSYVTFYAAWDGNCTTPLGMTSSSTFSATEMTKRINFQVTSFPTNGIIEWHIGDGTTITSQTFYAREN